MNKSKGKVTTLRKRVGRVDKKIDLIIGIPSFNEADNIGFVTQQVDWGLRKYFPEYSALIINVDNNSPDGTREAFLHTDTVTPREYISTPPGIRGKGNNFYNLFKAVQKYKAKAVLVVDADLRSITPEWVGKMLKPILNGYDYILPLYSRNEYDGTITNFICYPLIYGLLEYDIRQPIAGDFSFSAKLNDYWLTRRWYPNTYQYGIDIFMTMHAIFGEFKLGQVVLGSKIHKPSAPKLGIMFTEVVSTLFKNILSNKNKWQEKRGLEEVPIISNGYHSEPQPLCVDYKSIKAISLSRFNERRSDIKKSLPPRLFKVIDGQMQKKQMRINRKVWQEIVFSFLLSYYKSRYANRIIESLKPLYFARVASFIKQTLDMTHEEAEQLIVSQAKLFHRHRQDIIAKLK